MRNSCLKGNRNANRTKTAISISSNMMKQSFQGNAFDRVSTAGTEDCSRKQCYSQRQLSPQKQEDIIVNKPVKISSQRQISINSREFLDSNKMKFGDNYIQISPKVSILENKVEVNFISEFNRFSLSSHYETKKKRNIEKKQDQLLQQVVSSGILIKTPSKQDFSKPLQNTLANKGLLSKYKNLFINLMKNEKSDNQKINQRPSLQRQNSNIKLYP